MAKSTNGKKSPSVKGRSSSTGGAAAKSAGFTRRFARTGGADQPRARSSGRRVAPGGGAQSSGQSGRRFVRAGRAGQSSGQSGRRFRRPPGGGQAVRRRGPFSGSGSRQSTGPSGLVGRVQASLPSRGKPKDSKGSVADAASALLSSTGQDKRRPRMRSKKGALGLAVTAGVGAAALAKRRRSAGEQTEAGDQPLQPVGGEVAGRPPAQPQGSEAVDSPPAQPQGSDAGGGDQPLHPVAPEDSTPAA
jgi:hypothetical protein